MQNTQFTGKAVSLHKFEIACSSHNLSFHQTEVSIAYIANVIGCNHRTTYKVVLEEVLQEKLSQEKCFDNT
uniref:Uncharacterized protein n=1 Tax=Arundo donax TaxID=35708 RepID=A0A0A9AGJ4_ARUDO